MRNAPCGWVVIKTRQVEFRFSGRHGQFRVEYSNSASSTNLVLVMFVRSDILLSAASTSGESLKLRRIFNFRLARRFMCQTCIYTSQHNQLKITLRIYEMRFKPLFVMKTNRKKVSRAFRFNPEVNEKLRLASDRTGVTETKIVEDSIIAFLGGTFQERLAELSRSLPKQILAGVN